jgi:endonuclease YncB( thermonuclease family)
MFVSLVALLGAASVVPAGQSFTCTPTRVWDGDGPIWCAEGPRLRLAGVAAREMDGTCRSNQPCPGATAAQARDRLVSLVGSRTGWSSEGHALVRGPTMRCRSDGGAGGNRTAAWCTSPISGDVNCALVRSGVALKWQRYWGAHRC